MSLISHLSCLKFYSFGKDGYELPDRFISSVEMDRIEAKRASDRQYIDDLLEDLRGT